jgi:hypothetical protein
VKILDEKIIILQDVSAAKPEEVFFNSINVKYRRSDWHGQKRKLMPLILHLMKTLTSNTYLIGLLNF